MARTGRTYPAHALTQRFRILAPFVAGTASFVSSGPAGISISATDATGGFPAYMYQWQRNANGGAYSNLSNGGGVSGATTLNLLDGSAVAGTLYGYRLVYTDLSAATVTSNAVTAQYYTGGAIGSGGISYARLMGGL